MCRTLVISTMFLLLVFQHPQIRADDELVSRTVIKAFDRYLAELDEIDRVAALTGT